MPLTPLRRAGFSLAELLVAMALGATVGGLVLRLLVEQRRVGRAHAERAAAQATLRAGLVFLQSELREAGGDAAGPDILALAPESLTYRAMRGGGVVCGLTASVVTLDDRYTYGIRQLQPGRDSLLVYFEGDSTMAGDEHWLAAPILATAPSSCAGRPATAVATALDSVATPPALAALPAPARFFEVMQVKLYLSSGEYWLGARSVSAGEVIQPALGPLRPGGLVLSGIDSGAAAAATPAAVRALRVSLRARSGATNDSLAFTLQLRNWR